MRLCWLVLFCALSSQAATHYLTVSGLGGEPDYAQRFSMWAKQIGTATKSEPMIAPTRQQLRARFAELAHQVKPDDAFILTLIGHGTFDGAGYKFNLPGPDITAAELGSLLDHVQASRQLVVVMTSASGASVEALKRSTRVVITATRNGSEKNAVVFARYWAEALADPAADTDKNDSISAFEAFEYARKKTAQFFETNKRLATEHAQVDDTQRARLFAVLRIGSSAAAAADPARRALVEKKESVEQQIDQLKFEKVKLPEAVYKQRLTALLLELARVQEAIDR